MNKASTAQGRQLLSAPPPLPAPPQTVHHMAGDKAGTGDPHCLSSVLSNMSAFVLYLCLSQTVFKKTTLDYPEG